MISLIIPTYNSSQTVGACLDSVFRSSYDDIEVFVVDDASTDDTIRIIKEYPVKLIQLKERVGAAKARNIGARQAEGDILFFLDSDVTVIKDTLSRIIKFMKDHARYSAVIGSYTVKTEPNNFFTVYKNLVHHFTHQNSNGDASTFWGACGAIRKKVFDDVGGFRQRWRGAYVEDIELGYILTNKGYKIFLDNGIQVMHHKKYGFASIVRSDVFHRAVPWTKIILEHRIFRKHLNIQTSNVLSIPVCYLMLVGAVYSSVLFTTMGLLFLYLNQGIFYFVYNKKSLPFTLRFILMHYFSYMYQLVGMILGLVYYILKVR